MTERGLRHASAVAAAAGFALTAYILHARETGSALTCTTGGCETVQTSAYAEVLGIPVAGLGAGAYVAVFVTALLRGELARMTEAVVALAALGFGAYLLIVQIAVIGALCDWCLASDAITVVIAVLAFVRLRRGDAVEPSNGDRPWRPPVAARRTPELTR